MSAAGPLPMISQNFKTSKNKPKKRAKVMKTCKKN